MITMELATIDIGTHCARCGWEVETLAFEQPALLRSGGYGETLLETFRLCGCGMFATSTESISPLTDHARPTRTGREMTISREENAASGAGSERVGHRPHRTSTTVDDRTPGGR